MKAKRELPNREPTQALPEFCLSRGQAIWALTSLGFGEGVSADTFQEYIKSLRKAGIPFAPGERGASRSASYSFVHLMELALVLMLRMYHIVPDALLAEIIRHRVHLHRQFRAAFLHRMDDKVGSFTIDRPRRRATIVKGLFLDLRLEFSGGRMTRFGPPRLVSPTRAVEIYLLNESPARIFAPINLSLLAERVARAAGDALGQPRRRKKTTLN